MKDSTLKVGSRKSGDAFHVSVKVRVAETDADVVQLCKDETIRVACFNRGFRIRRQENSGARELVSKATIAERKEMTTLSHNVAALVAKYEQNPIVSHRSERTTAPTIVALPVGLSTKDTERFSAILKAQGITVTIAQ